MTADIGDVLVAFTAKDLYEFAEAAATAGAGGTPPHLVAEHAVTEAELAHIEVTGGRVG